MTQTVRLDQTLTGMTTWTRNGSPVSPAPTVTASVSDPSKASVNIVFWSFGLGVPAGYKVTLHPIALATGLVVKLTGSDGSVAQDTVDITPATPPVGTIVWDPPTPA